MKATCLVLLVSLSSVLSASTTTVQLTTGHWPPYFDEDSSNGGFVAELIDAAFATQEMEVEFTFLPWSRALFMVNAKRFDGTAIWSCTEDRSEHYYYSNAIVPYRYVFYHRKDQTFDWNSVADLSGKIIGITQDYSYSENITPLLAEGIVQTDVTTSDQANFKKLLAGRIDLFPMDPVTGQALIKEWFAPEQASQLTFHPKSIRRGFYHVLFSKQASDGRILRDQLNAGLQELRQTGQFESIIDRGLERSGLPVDRLYPELDQWPVRDCD